MSAAAAELNEAGQTPGWQQSRRLRQRAWHLAVYVVLIAVSIVMVLPLYWLVNSALKPEDSIFTYPPSWLPVPFTTSNFTRALTGRIEDAAQLQVEISNFDFPLYVRNSLIIIVGNMVIGVTMSTLVAYGLARMQFRGRNLLFYSVIVAMFLPPVVMIIPRFVIFSRLQMVGTLWPLIVPGLFGYANQIFFLRQFFLTVPRELEDAALVDGCSSFRFWWQILLPLSRAAVAAQLIITFVYHWNDFLDPLIYLGQSAGLRTVQLAVVLFMNPRNIRYGVLMAYAAVLAAPPLIVFFLAQRVFIQGIVFTGNK